MLNEGIELKQVFNKQHTSQKFYYNYADNEEDLKIFISLFNGRILINVKIDQTFYTKMNLIDDSNLVTIQRYMINKICQGKSRCPINIEIINNHDYIFFTIFNNGKKF